MKKRVHKNTLLKVLAVQEVYLEHKHEGVTNVYIFKKHIKPVFFISERTFYRYLGINAKKEIRQFENNETVQLSAY